jgi:pimeloyl-ACP methyl ester carboxylesterase
MDDVRMRLSHLVVVVPGIGGSVLQRPGSSDVVWSHGRSVLLRALRNPAVLNVDEPLVPVGLLQDIQIVPGWTATPGYTALWNDLARLPGAVADPGGALEGPNPAANVIAFPYDFRRDIRDAAAALDRRVRGQLASLGRADESGSVIVVAHSMGGLVARYWIAKLGGHQVCRALMTLGTPHRGAPKALDIWANGVPVRVGGFTRRLAGLSRELRRWPSMGQLLPRYPCIQNPGDPGIGVQVRDLDQLSPAWSGLADAGREGWGFHREIQDGWDALTSVPQMRVRVGFAQPVWCDLGMQLGDAGDGTVPSVSAFPVEFETAGFDPSVAQVPVTHGRIGNDLTAAGFIGSIEGWFARPTGVRGQEGKVGLGVSVAEINAAGHPVTVRVRVHGADPGALPEQAVWVRTVAAGEDSPAAAAPVPPLRAVWDGATAEYVAHVEGLLEGMWTVTASARAVPAVGDVASAVEFTVVDVGDIEW